MDPAILKFLNNEDNESDNEDNSVHDLSEGDNSEQSDNEDNEDNEHSDNDSEDANDEDANDEDTDEDGNDEDNDEDDNDEDENEDDEPLSDDDKPKKIIAPMSEKQLKLFKEAMDKRGVCYISRIPPLMTPLQLRQNLSVYGEICRLFIATEDPLKARQRKKNGGNGRKRYTEGWVEFADKKVAKAVANTLNATPIASKKSSRFHDDLWNLKYLSGFTWNQLKEQITYERAARESKMQAEISQSRKETEFIMDSYKKAKVNDFRTELQNRRKENEDSSLVKRKNDTNEDSFKPRVKVYTQKQVKSLNDAPMNDSLLSRITAK